MPCPTPASDARARPAFAACSDSTVIGRQDEPISAPIGARRPLELPTEPARDEDDRSFKSSSRRRSACSTSSATGCRVAGLTVRLLEPPLQHGQLQERAVEGIVQLVREPFCQGSHRRQPLGQRRPAKRLVRGVRSASFMMPASADLVPVPQAGARSAPETRNFQSLWRARNQSCASRRGHSGRSASRRLPAPDALGSSLGALPYFCIRY